MSQTTVEGDHYEIWESGVVDEIECHLPCRCVRVVGSVGAVRRRTIEMVEGKLRRILGF